MDKELARHVAVVAFKASSSVASLVPLLKEHCEPGEYEAYAKAIASIAFEIHAELLKKIFSEHPEIEKEIEYKINKYGQLI